MSKRKAIFKLFTAPIVDNKYISIIVLVIMLTAVFGLWKALDKQNDEYIHDAVVSEANSLSDIMHLEAH